MEKFHMVFGIVAADISIFKLELLGWRRSGDTTNQTKAALKACGPREMKILREFYMRDADGSFALWLPHDDQIVKPLIKKGALLCEIEKSPDGEGVLCSINDAARLAIARLASRRYRIGCGEIAWSDVALRDPRKRAETLIRMRQDEMLRLQLSGTIAVSGCDGRPEWFCAKGRAMNGQDETILEFQRAARLAAARGISFTVTTPPWLGLDDRLLTFLEKWHLSRLHTGLQATALPSRNYSAAWP